MKITIDRTLSPAEIAEAFCELDDEQQAQVFIEIAAIARRDWSPHGFNMQWLSIGGHLRDCACSNDDARNVVLSIAEALEPRQ